MLGEERVGGHKSGEIRQCPSADSLAGNSAPPPLVIGEPDLPLAQLFERDAVCRAKEVDRSLLASIDPACECCEDNLPGLKRLGHNPIVATFGSRY